MTAAKQQYVAPICTVVSFQVEENVNSTISHGTAEYFVGDDAAQDDFDDDEE